MVFVKVIRREVFFFFGVIELVEWKVGGFRSYFVVFLERLFEDEVMTRGVYDEGGRVYKWKRVGVEGLRIFGVSCF